VTQRIPPIRTSDTAPLWRSEIGQLDSLLDSPPPRPPAPKPSRRGLLLKGLGLVGVAVVSGLVWLVVMPKNEQTGTPAPTSAPPGEFTFAKSPEVPEPLKDSNCAPHAYGETQKFLTATPCQQLTRGLYTTTVSGSGKVLVSVVVVRMHDDEAAVRLKQVTDGNGTGNIYDLAKEGIVKVEGGPAWVAHGGYASTRNGRNVVIVESDLYGATKDSPRDRDLLRRISTEALMLAEL
jgi:hypothetical protein